MYEVYVQDSAGPSKKHKSRNFGEKSKVRAIPTYKLAPNIKQQTHLKNVSEERILNSQVDYSLRELLWPVKEFDDRRPCEESKTDTRGVKCPKSEHKYHVGGRYRN